MIQVPTTEDFQRGCSTFQAKEKRDAMYKTATFLIDHFWGQAPEIADSLGVLLLTWNQAFYRYGAFDFHLLEEAIADNQTQLGAFRVRDILSYSTEEDVAIKLLFNRFMVALQICEGAKKGTQSPVSAAKTLHLLAPRFFPLWDLKIANAYGCRYAHNPSDQYVRFIGKTKGLAERLAEAAQVFGSGKSLLKLIDEYNYAKYTKGWVL